MSDTQNDPDKIEHELAATRARLGDRLDELTSRLSPGQLLDEGLSYLRDGDGAVFVSNLRQQVRDNPLPVALTGIGLAWLAVSGGMRSGARRSSSRAIVPYDEATAGLHATRDDVAERARRVGAAVTRFTNETDDAFRARVSEAQGKVLGVTRQAQETAQAFGDRVREALDRARETAASWRDSAVESMHGAGEMAASGRRKAAEAGERVSRAGGYVSDAGGRLANAVVENPLLLSAMSMTAGALFGALLPQTEFEERQFGGAGERVAGAAQEVAQDALQRGAHVMRAATDAGLRAMHDEGAELPGKPDREPQWKGSGADGGTAPRATT